MKTIRFAIFLATTLLVIHFSPLAFAQEEGETKHTMETDEWSLMFDPVESNKDKEFNLYHIELLNKGLDKKDVKIFSFREEPQKSHDFGLMFEDNLNEAKNNQIVLDWSELPVSSDVEQFEILVIWKDNENRSYKQSFSIPN